MPGLAGPGINERGLSWSDDEIRVVAAAGQRPRVQRIDDDGVH
jgi:hypothetical protein